MGHNYMELIVIYVFLKKTAREITRWVGNFLTLTRYYDHRAMGGKLGKHLYSRAGSNDPMFNKRDMMAGGVKHSCFQGVQAKRPAIALDGNDPA